MRIAIIADDLTGANDSGVQLAKQGLKASVVLNSGTAWPVDAEVAVFDTDSRGVSKAEAYRRVKEAAEQVQRVQCEIIFKKIDSTMRGNIGAEIDAVYDAIQPELVVIAPAYPKNGRIIVGGYLYVNGKPLHETEVSRDPKTPVKESDVCKLIQSQTNRKTALVPRSDLASGNALKHKLEFLREQGYVYIVFDTVEERDMRLIVETVEGMKLRTIWTGSAGLAAYLPYSRVESGQAQRLESLRITQGSTRNPVLLVVGSMSRISRAQLSDVLSKPETKGIEAKSSVIAGGNGAERRRELERVKNEALHSFRSGKHTAIYSSPDELPMEQRSLVAAGLGEIAAELIGLADWNGIVLTGGDTARQFSSFAKMEELLLLGEVEAGIPLGLFRGKKELYAVTKAGGFGTEEALGKAIDVLSGQIMI